MEHSQHYFGAGPAAIPKSVKQQIQKDILQYGVCDSILELSHRSQEFFVHTNECSEFAAISLCNTRQLSYLIYAWWGDVAI